MSSLPFSPFDLHTPGIFEISFAKLWKAEKGLLDYVSFLTRSVNIYLYLGAPTATYGYILVRANGRLRACLV